MADDAGDVLYEGLLQLRFALSFQEYYCVFTDTGVLRLYADEASATARPGTTVKQTRVIKVKEWSGETMFGAHENSFKIVTQKGSEVPAAARNRIEGTLWVKSITAVTEPESHEGLKLQKHKRKAARALEKEKKRQEEYEARAKAHRALPTVPSGKPDVPPISYLTDPRRTRLDARNFPKYREHLKAHKIETRLTASLDEAKKEDEKKKKKSKRKKKMTTTTTRTTSTRRPRTYRRRHRRRRRRRCRCLPPFNNLLKLGLSHDEVKNFMTAEGHSPAVLNQTSLYLSQSSLAAPSQTPAPAAPPKAPGSPLKKARKSRTPHGMSPASQMTSAPAPVAQAPPSPPARKSLLDQIRSGFRFKKKT
ncbi:hypothetical protein SPRG_11386 [Saprolegnia parasitica CBS 223.65]|uniref:PH domain-containing protein n=1 Tax=Saprolegnia parasitica (strain CBS 223.65) TaxID=695850 RepID=A0A067BYU6_SAPPC|nr:hypothetical protein SPRG_11386 [Saprolegnia parasitica CBS 223.65]KDO23463.1 hypothetical protein SPRG_11386 [Saprolegnia parasitica CBS 223.65]|eukprot:XP_012205779.1 hypothetical protein SPRG_11386 [Saprolegnia parasitica CBS 223.65]